MSARHLRTSLRVNQCRYFRYDLGSRAGQRPASTRAMKSATASLNSAGSSWFTTWPVLGNTTRPDGRHPLLEQKARLQARLVLVADDDQRRHRDLAKLGFEVVERGPLGLKAAHGVARAQRVVLGEHLVELLEAARVLHQERDARRADAVGLAPPRACPSSGSRRPACFEFLRNSSMWARSEPEPAPAMVSDSARPG